MSKWIKFTEVDLGDGRKTKVWCVWTLDGCHLLGRVWWYAQWRKYAFISSYHVHEDQIVLEEDCLRDIATFLEEQTEIRKQERKKEKETTV